MNRILATLGLVLALGLAGPVHAQDALAAAKAAGQIGERPDGLVGVVSGAPASAAQLAEQVNAQRIARYRDIARGNGTSVDQVQALAGQQLIDRTPAGQYVLSGGQWVRK
ncbi:YdbL family protein [Azospirillum sp. sgz302134]